MKVTATCPECMHYKDCCAPCIFVKKYLDHNKGDQWEKSFKTDQSKPITIYFGAKRVINETFVMGQGNGNKKPYLFKEKNPFKHFDPKLVKTGIFIDRFFGKWNYTDLAVKYDTSVENVRSYYHSAVLLLLQLLKDVDSNRVRKLNHIKKQIDKRSGSLQKGQRWFLINKLFDLTPSQIAEFEGLSNSKPVYKAIKYTSDRIAAGKLEIFKPDPKTMEAAKARLEAKKAKDNDYRTRNIEKLRAKDRERYARCKINT